MRTARPPTVTKAWRRRLDGLERIRSQPLSSLMVAANRVALLAVGVAVVLAACGVEESDSPPITTDSNATTTTADDTAATGEATSTTSSRSDLEIAEAAVLRVENLPEGWVECCPPEIPLADQLRGHICGSPEGLEPRTAAYVRRYAFNLRADGTMAGHLSAAVYLSATEEAATTEFTGVDAASYESCAIEGVAEMAVIYRPDRTAEPTVTFERAAPLAVDVPVSLDRFVSWTPVGSVSAPLYTALLRLRVGRALVRIEIDTFAVPSAVELLQDVADASVVLVREALADA